MENKLNLPKLWKTCTLIFFAVCWIILSFVLKLSIWYIVPIMIIYFAVNALIFNSYFLGMLGNFFLISGKHQKALKFYKKAVKKNTRNVSALYAYAVEILKEDGRAEEALKILERAERLNAKIQLDKNIRLAMSSCLWVMNDIDGAIKILERLKKDYVYVNSHVHTTLGYFYYLKKDYETALAESKTALEDEPQHAAAWDNIGQIQYSLGNIQEAKDAFIKALTYRKTMVDSLYYLGIIYENEGNIAEAADCFLKTADCNISSLNTVTKEQVKEKYEKYKNYPN